MRRRIVLSGVNISELGILAIFKDALSTLAAEYSEKYEIIAIVHRRELYDTQNVTYLEFPKVKSSWLRRLYFEYVSSNRICRQLGPEVWVSMHDMTPNVSAPVRAVYCHNATPFHPFRLSEALVEWKFGFFVMLYGFIYRINIHSNNFVIVQQRWMREQFRKSYGVHNLVVAHPVFRTQSTPEPSQPRKADQTFRFFYPARPRPFKNVEACLEAARILERRGMDRFELWLTFDASVSKYAADIIARFSDVRTVRWLGICTREKIFEMYSQADCLLFPSKLETWGVPITEFRPYGKPILVADLPYARETAGGHDQVAFFDPNNPANLADLMEQAATGVSIFAKAPEPIIEDPFASNWSELWSLLLPQGSSRVSS